MRIYGEIETDCAGGGRVRGDQSRKGKSKKLGMNTMSSERTEVGYDAAWRCGIAT